MSYSLLAAPTEYPVTLIQAKSQCRVDGTTDDDYLNTLIAAATAHVETLIGKLIMEQTWLLSLDGFSDSIELRKGPVRSITSVKYFDADGDEQTLSSTYYTLDSVNEPQWLVRNDSYDWPTILEAVNAVNITFVAGYSTIPPSIQHAVLLLIGQWYDQRAGVSDKPVTETPNSVKALLFSQQAMVI